MSDQLVLWVPVKAIAWKMKGTISISFGVEGPEHICEDANQPKLVKDMGKKGDNK